MPPTCPVHDAVNARLHAWDRTVGHLAFALAGDGAEIWAVDQEAGSVEFARRKALRLGATRIRWIAAAAEDVALDGAFDLVAIGNAFHRLDRCALDGAP